MLNIYYLNVFLFYKMRYFNYDNALCEWTTYKVRVDSKTS